MAEPFSSSLTREYFEDLAERLMRARGAGEHLFLSLSGESSQFIRLNGSRVRQIGRVDDAELEIILVQEAKEGTLRKGSRAITLSGLLWKDEEEAKRALGTLRNEVLSLPVDPYAQLPQDFGSMNLDCRGELLPFDAAVDAILIPAVARLDLAGIYAAGPVFRAMANSAGQRLWFHSETFSMDYSVYTASQRALKGTFAGSSWRNEDYAREIERAREKLPILEIAPVRVPRGPQRVFLAPACISDLLGMFSWGGFSEASIREGQSALRHLRSGERSLSPAVTIAEDFRNGQVPRFNSLGEIAPECLPLIEKGALKSSLVSARSAKEYGLTSNGATVDESPRSLSMEGGILAEDQILKTLDNGLYLSNLHYLNWSDQPGGRVTGMTRYACFRVESGKIVSPIENMRWDDSLFALFGSALEALTVERRFCPEVHSYVRRQLGGTLVPGMLVRQMQFTL